MAIFVRYETAAVTGGRCGRGKSTWSVFKVCVCDYSRREGYIFLIEWEKEIWKQEHTANAIFHPSDFLHSSHLRRSCQTLGDQPSPVMPCCLQHRARSRTFGWLREVCKGNTDECVCSALQLILFSTIWHFKAPACCLWTWASISLRGSFPPTPRSTENILGERRCSKKCKLRPLTEAKPWHISCGQGSYVSPDSQGHTHVSFPFPSLAGIFPIHLLANGIWYRFSPCFVSLPLHNEVMLWHDQSCLCVSFGPHQLLGYTSIKEKRLSFLGTLPLPPICYRIRDKWWPVWVWSWWCWVFLTNQDLKAFSSLPMKVLHWAWSWWWSILTARASSRCLMES